MAEELTPLHITLSDGRQVTIPKHYVDFFYSLRACEDETLIQIFNIHPDSMMEFIDRKRYEYKCAVLKHFKTKYLFRETGEPVEWMPEMLPTVTKSVEELTKIIKSKHGMPYKTLKILYDFFENNNEIYTPENR